MGIDIYARWDGQTEIERRTQGSAWLSTEAGEHGYLREAYHGEPYATRFLCKEAFAEREAFIPAEILRERLDETLRLVEERARKVYHSDDETVEKMKQSFRDFVNLCERKEKETGQAVLIIASY